MSALTNVYNPEAFPARVNYAAQCLIRRIDSRRRDTCFEMNDGDAVVVALVRRAAKNPRLKEAIARGWSELRDGFPVGWLALAEEHAGVTDLPALARSMRERSAPAWACPSKPPSPFPETPYFNRPRKSVV